jgi:hypothetical protein
VYRSYSDPYSHKNFYSHCDRNRLEYSNCNTDSYANPHRDINCNSN